MESKPEWTIDELAERLGRKASTLSQCLNANPSKFRQAGKRGAQKLWGLVQDA